MAASQIRKAVRRWMADDMSDLVNSFIVALLRSPLHGLMSGSVAVVHVTGRASGRVYEVPVNYEDRDATIWVTSLRSRSWWKNLRGGQPLIVERGRKSLHGIGEVLEDTPDVKAYFMEYLRNYPERAKYFGISKTEDAADLNRQIQDLTGERVVVRIDLHGILEK
jgi:hypothetical protein